MREMVLRKGVEIIEPVVLFVAIVMAVYILPSHIGKAVVMLTMSIAFYRMRAIVCYSHSTWKSFLFLVGMMLTMFILVDMVDRV
ncbi:hypothetical protein [Pampinifervens florentissimum]|uniref:hypothetical protein n=1 Tax=Pampinifervens florentissimum TaxID=1632019 RepID=UPI0013B49087|nr:hypothetical protein [Hydrogenobacter sp. T-8]QID33041.1 hypothetical protein G3M65_04375 [Hydrogenobacter sp. T-8]